MVRLDIPARLDTPVLLVFKVKLAEHLVLQVPQVLQALEPQAHKVPLVLVSLELLAQRVLQVSKVKQVEHLDLKVPQEHLEFKAQQVSVALQVLQAQQDLKDKSVLQAFRARLAVHLGLLELRVLQGQRVFKVLQDLLALPVSVLLGLLDLLVPPAYKARQVPVLMVQQDQQDLLGQLVKQALQVRKEKQAEHQALSVLRDRKVKPELPVLSV
jgi:hypothetical protein